ncbi:hypothetical protein LTS12_014848 [Elasticomyces elasticus]|nr:hypothetical protein LTS12_014848 [Elasticomyces elasticus]
MNFLKKKPHDIRALEDELGALRKQQRHLDAVVKSNEAEIDRLHNNVKRNQQQHRAEAHDLERKIHEAKSEIEQRAQQHRAEVRNLEQDISKVKIKAERREGNVGKSHRREINALEEQIRQTKKNAEQEFEKHRAELDKSHSREVNALEEQIRQTKKHAEQECEKHRAELDTLVEKHRAELGTLINTAKSKEQNMAQQQAHMIADLNRKSSETKKKLLLEAQEIKDAWLSRDDEMYQFNLFGTPELPNKPDGKIRDQMQELHHLIDDLSRIEWRAEQNSWADGVVQRNAERHGQRPVKKAIAQDLIWSLLFERVFCSPFRSFGEPGRALEREWNEKCGTGDDSTGGLYAWPVPSVKTERFRYLGVHACHEALTTPIASVDRRAEVKRGFRKSQDELVAALTNELGKMMHLSSQEVQLVVRLAKKAASVWLDFARHRFRIIIRLGRSEATLAEKATAVGGSGILTVEPVVGRYGNAQGLELESYMIIKGCEGRTLEID